VVKEYGGPERRRYPRTDANFVVSYRIAEEPNNYDLSQTKNVGQGGMLITTNQYFGKGVRLAMFIRFPFIPHKIEVIGEVVECQEVVRNVIYDTRIKFLDLDMTLFKKIGELVEKYLKEKQA
jgi:hypothetical protein